MSIKRALFLDRDGVINQDLGYVYKPEDCHFMDGVDPLLQAAKAKDYLIIIITNQAGIGRGYYTEEGFHQFMGWMNEQLHHQIDAVYFCPFHAEHGIGKYKQHSLDRKPEPGMLLKAFEDHGIDPGQSLMIGDREKDMMAASKAGISTELFFSDQSLPDCISIASLKEALPYL